MPKIDASGPYVRKLFVAACDKEKKNNPTGEETGHAPRPLRIDGENLSIRKLASASQAISNAATAYQNLYR